jgi:hypothetical protein
VRQGISEKMGCLSIQIQPDLVSSINSDGITSFLNNEGYSPEITEGYDSGAFINLNIKTHNVKVLWVKIEKYLKNHSELFNCTIITCEGSQGWDNYLLLHHFDSTEKFDEI